MSDLSRRIFSLFFPEHCPFCDNIISPGEDWCADCRKQVAKTEDCCPYCGKPVCECKERKHLDRVYSLYFYEGSVRDAILKMKGDGRAAFCRSFGRILADRIPNEGFDWITCVPMSKKELRKRGYNPQEWLAKYIAKEKGLCFRPLLMKQRETEAQHTLPLAKRKTNLNGAFALSKQVEILGKRILLIDDILTSGATLEESARVLKEGGAASVFAAVIAVTDNRLKPKEKSDIIEENGENSLKTD